MTNNWTVFDIETGPTSETRLAELMPPFDPETVKCGNIKDPDKIKEKVLASEAAYKAEWAANASLDATTGTILAIGLRTESCFKLIEGKPRDMIAEFWALWGATTDQWIGFNIALFDMPFLVRSSWLLNVPMPAGVRHGRYWHERFVDLRDVWQLGDRQAKGSLDYLSRAFGIGAKTGTGAEFANLWASDKEQAIAYLKNDCELTVELATRLGVITRP